MDTDGTEENVSLQASPSAVWKEGNLLVATSSLTTKANRSDIGCRSRVSSETQTPAPVSFVSLSDGVKISKYFKAKLHRKNRT